MAPEQDAGRRRSAERWGIGGMMLGFTVMVLPMFAIIYTVSFMTAGSRSEFHDLTSFELSKRTLIVRTRVYVLPRIWYNTWMTAVCDHVLAKEELRKSTVRIRIIVTERREGHVFEGGTRECRVLVSKRKDISSTRKYLDKLGREMTAKEFHFTETRTQKTPGPSK